LAKRGGDWAYEITGGGRRWAGDEKGTRRNDTDRNRVMEVVASPGKKQEKQKK